MKDASPRYQVTQNIVTTESERDIVIVFYNDYFDRNQKYNRDFSYASELLKFSWSVTSNTLNQCIDFIMSDNLEQALLVAKRMKFKCAIVQTPGHILRNNFIESLNELRNQEWFLIGHLLEKNDYIWLHEQCFVLNLEKMYEDELIAGEAQANTLVPLYTRSDENFHDTYTPKWVTFNGEYGKRNVQWGWRWIAKGLVNSKILTFNEELRSKKMHLYPENPGHYDTWYRRIEGTQMDNAIKQFDKFNERKIHLFNNEMVSRELILHQTRQNSFDNIVVLASGFYGMKTAKLFDPEKIIYYDVLPDMLDVTRKINNTWDGIEDLNSYVIDQNVFHNPSVRKYGLFSEGIFQNQAELEEYIPQFRNIEKEYHIVDIIENPEAFLNIVPFNGTTYVWLDSIFTYWYNLWQYRPREIQDCYDKIINGLKQRDNDIWIHVKDPNGYIRVLHNKSVDTRFLNTQFASNYRTWS